MTNKEIILKILPELKMELNNFWRQEGLKIEILKRKQVITCYEILERFLDYLKK